MCHLPMQQGSKLIQLLCHLIHLLLRHRHGTDFNYPQVLVWIHGHSARYVYLVL